VVHDASGRVSAFVEKPPRDKAPTDEINAGTYLLEPAILDRIPAGQSVSIERATFPELLAGGEKLYAYTTEDYWLDVGRPDQYLQAHRDVLDGKLELEPTADPEAHQGTFYFSRASNAPRGIQPPVFLGADATIDPQAEVGPYSVIGNNSRIEAGACVKGTVAWDGVVVYSKANVIDAILASNVRVGNDARVGAGSVIGHDVVIEAAQNVPNDSRILGPQLAAEIARGTSQR
jgi:mannose-1-phosphate guanylyltransferase